MQASSFSLTPPPPSPLTLPTPHPLPPPTLPLPNPFPNPFPNPSPQDPREYLPFLNQLRKLPPPYRYYTIDKHLGRYKKALRNIVACGELSSLKVVLLVQQFIH